MLQESDDDESGTESDDEPLVKPKSPQTSKCKYLKITNVSKLIAES